MSPYGERRARAMLLSGRMPFTELGREALDHLHLVGTSPRPYVPVLASDSLAEVLELVADEERPVILVLDEASPGVARVDLSRHQSVPPGEPRVDIDREAPVSALVDALLGSAQPRHVIVDATGLVAHALSADTAA